MKRDGIEWRAFSNVEKRPFGDFATGAAALAAIRLGASPDLALVNPDDLAGFPVDLGMLATASQYVAPGVVYLGREAVTP